MKPFPPIVAGTLVSIDDLYPDPAQPRTVMDPMELDALAGSIAAIGVLAPISVRVEERGLIIVDGHRRHAAARRAGLQQVPVVLSASGNEPAGVVREQLATLCRADLNPMDLSDAIHRQMHEHGVTAASVAKSIGRSAGQVSKLLTLQLLSPEAKERVRRGQLGMAEAYRLASGRESSKRTHDAALRGGSRGRRSAKPVIRVQICDGIRLVASMTSGATIDTLISELAAMSYQLTRLQSEGKSTVEALVILAEPPTAGVPALLAAT